MSRGRAGLSLGVIVALAVAIWAAVASGDDDPSPSTTNSSTSIVQATTAAVPTTTTTPPTTTTTSTVAPTTTPTTTDPDARREEVRLILQDLWYRWFDAIYRNDEEAVRDVVATQEALESFREAVSRAEYPSAPRKRDVAIGLLEILRDTPECLVTYATIDLSSWRGEGAISEAVEVLWPYEGGWRRANVWRSPGDLWEDDCESIRVELD